jgi:flagellar hook-associated protein 1 FlgK
MQSYAIGISGLSAAQAGLDIIGNNIANAATEGYHRQRVELVPLSYGQTAAGSVGAGVDVAGVTRLIDGLLERELVRKQSASGQVSQELSTLSTVETTLGEFTEGSGLNATIDGFFEALRGLAAHPLDQVWRNETINAAQTLASEFQRLGTSLAGLEGQLVLEAHNTVDTINALVSQIAELNASIQATQISQGPANNLCDQRDHLVTELADLIGIEVQPREGGQVDVSVDGLPLVSGGSALGLEVKLRDDQTLGVFTLGSGSSNLDIQGGRLGGLLALKNDLLGGLRADLDTLAATIIEQINRSHVQGLGQDGSFTQLTGWALADDDLSTNPSVSDGIFYVRVTNTTTGEVQRYGVDVNVSGPIPDTPAAVAARIDTIPGVSASISSSRLHIMADPGYTFDFIPAVLPEPTATSFTATSPPAVTVSGLYEGPENHTFIFTVAGSGSVGNGALLLDVTNENGDVVDSLNIGAGYAAGDVMEMSNGIRIAVGLGELNAGDSFEVEAFATTDTSGFLAAAGMNAFFAGTGAADMQVCREVVDAPDRIATAQGSALTDNLAALRLAGVGEEAITALGGMTPSEYYHRTVANLAQLVALKEARQENIEAVVQNLRKQRSEISSVNINDEAAQLLVFEKMFQAMGKYLSVLQTQMTTLMDMI